MLDEFVWVSWKDARGWHPKHAIPTRADTAPRECAGLMTLCGHYIPDGALDYAYSPRGPCRRYERKAPVLAEIFRLTDRDSSACILCRDRLAEARPDLYSVPREVE